MSFEKGKTFYGWNMTSSFWRYKTALFLGFGNTWYTFYRCLHTNKNMQAYLLRFISVDPLESDTFSALNIKTWQCLVLVSILLFYFCLRLIHHSYLFRNYPLPSGAAFPPLQQRIKTLCHPMISLLPKPVNRRLSRFLFWIPANCLVSMVTTPRACTWTVEDIGTQQHNKDDKTLSYIPHSTMVLLTCVCELIRPISCPRGESFGFWRRYYSFLCVSSEAEPYGWI